MNASFFPGPQHDADDSCAETFSWSRRAFSDETYSDVVECITVTYERHGVWFTRDREGSPGWYFTLEAYTATGGEVLHNEVRGPYPSSLIALVSAYGIIVQCENEQREEEREAAAATAQERTTGLLGSLVTYPPSRMQSLDELEAAAIAERD